MTDELAPTLMAITGADIAAPALSDSRRTLTWGDLEARTNALGSGIEHDLGVAPGSHVTVIARNRHEFVEAMVGAMRAGMTTIQRSGSSGNRFQPLAPGRPLAHNASRWTVRVAAATSGSAAATTIVINGASLRRCDRRSATPDRDSDERSP